MTTHEMIRGLEILNSYSSKGKDSTITFGHFIVMFDPCLTDNEISQQDSIELSKMRWFYSTHEYKCWVHFG